MGNESLPRFAAMATLAEPGCHCIWCKIIREEAMSKPPKDDAAKATWKTAIAEIKAAWRGLRAVIRNGG